MEADGDAGFRADRRAGVRQGARSCSVSKGSRPGRSSSSPGCGPNSADGWCLVGNRLWLTLTKEIKNEWKFPWSEGNAVDPLNIYSL